MHEILLRGKRIDNGEWIEGAYCKHDTVKICFSSDDPKTKHLIITDGFCDWGFEPPLTGYEVDPETVGQYTGLKDMNGKRIFEGDIVKAQDNLIFSPFCDGLVGKVVYIETAFFIEPKDPTKAEYLFNECAVYEVLGNIHDNPELLEAL